MEPIEKCNTCAYFKKEYGAAGLIRDDDDLCRLCQAVVALLAANADLET